MLRWCKTSSNGPRHSPAMKRRPPIQTGDRSRELATLELPATMFRYLPLMIKNSLRNRRRSVLTIGSIAVSLCILGVLFAMYRSLFLAEATPAQALRLVCRHRVSLTQSMPISYRQKIERIPGVKQVMVWQWFGGAYKDRRDPKNLFARFAAEPDRFFRVHPEYEMPEDQKLAFQRERTGCILSDELQRKLGLKIGDRVTLVGDNVG